MPKIVNPLTIVKTGGTPTPVGPLDPEQVYRDTRPADWLVMPEPGENEAYMLIQIGADAVDDFIARISLRTTVSSATATLEFGVSDSTGTFTPDSDLTVTASGSTSLTLYEAVPSSAFGNVTTEGKKQLLAKVSVVGGDVTYFLNETTEYYASIKRNTVELSVNMPQLTRIMLGSNTDSGGVFSNLRYCWLDTPRYNGINYLFGNCCKLVAVRRFTAQLTTSFSYMFQNCHSLTAIPQLDTSNGTTFQNMFAGCRSLTAIPQLDTRNVADFQGMFQNCCSLTTVPQLDTSNSTDFQSMFAGCSSLTTIPQLDTSSGTNFNNMFAGCYSLTAIPQLDTSNCTNFNSMFSNCFSLTAIPQLDTSSGTNFSYMFQNCYSLTTIPQLNTSNGTTFQNMFNYCSSLTTIPQLNTSNGTNFSYMLSYCYSLTTVPQLNTSSGTNFSNMFANCFSLTAIPQLDTSSGTNVSSMFSNCYSLTVADFRGYNFSSVTSASNILNLTTALPNLTIDFGDSWGPNGIITTSALVRASQTYPAAPYKVRIHKTDAMLPIAVNATTLFNGSHRDIYVPDALLATYQANQYWATLGTHLKAMSEWSA